MRVFSVHEASSTVSAAYDVVIFAIDWTKSKQGQLK
jgi:hypothetical protein